MTNPTRAAFAAFRLATARDYLRDRFAEPVTIADLASLAGMTRWNFVRAYRRAYGLTPHREMVDLRVALAQRLLDDPVMAIEDVATASGFGSRTALYRNFVRRTRVSPLQWQARWSGGRRRSGSTGERFDPETHRVGPRPGGG